MKYGKYGYTTIIDDGYQEHIRWLMSHKNTKDMLLSIFHNMFNELIYKELNQVIDGSLVDEMMDEKNIKVEYL